MRLIHGIFLLLATVSPVFAEEAPVADVAVPQLSPAEMRADKLDSLFAKLRLATEQGNPAAIEQQIWTLWMQSDSATAEVLLGQGTHAMDAGENAVAEEVLNGLISAYPDNAEALNKRATLYYMMNRNEDSLADIARVLDLEPRHFGALSGKGMILAKLGKHGEALKAFRAALAINPHMPGAKAAVSALEKLERDI